jgi:hypothetical protein
MDEMPVEQASEAPPGATVVQHCRSFSDPFPTSSRSFPAVPGIIRRAKAFEHQQEAVLHIYARDHATLSRRPENRRRCHPADAQRKEIHSGGDRILYANFFMKNDDKSTRKYFIRQIFYDTFVKSGDRCMTVGTRP